MADTMTVLFVAFQQCRISDRTTALGTIPKLTQRLELVSNWTALKLTVVSTR